MTNKEKIMEVFGQQLYKDYVELERYWQEAKKGVDEPGSVDYKYIPDRDFLAQCTTFINDLGKKIDVARNAEFQQRNEIGMSLGIAIQGFKDRFPRYREDQEMLQQQIMQQRTGGLIDATGGAVNSDEELEMPALKGEVPRR